MFIVKVSQYEVGQQKKQVNRFGLLLHIYKKSIFALSSFPVYMPSYGELKELTKK